MFVPIGAVKAAVTIYLDGKPISAREGETIAACLLRADVRKFRTTPVSGVPRLPYCMIGHCFDCLIEIGGVGSRQACLTQVQEGMQLSTQHGPAAVFFEELQP
ncbi:(2Fe-2S)-binding protein [Pseudomonas gingeri]|uniref:(2Fe-2S)-binding protein n=1 Tax=Pseudomonas gingeri TaxID=117681 RepID=A0A7Y7YHD4_9PSED|nr:(2Fe-2S)-binding protein [Pseudomonas gingeri]NWB31300.1 (2Fe-2S)-binding protein [Pseudomonas gingeri]NWC35836.1 (2Fe-2S)-binding protein [Pseudomonas gingeri]NWD06285.1 (2Fe-2S)-binding protein [Pseudomonas gingeri]NWD49328.1 (2Fe-2S)-binding protein [Pseudomonas gingeri]NWE32877.1 (2Fe-2S)-binding protein [Pseudomonas gingeri]